MRRVARCTRVRWSETITIGFCTYPVIDSIYITKTRRMINNSIKCKKMSREYAKSLKKFFFLFRGSIFFFVKVTILRIKKSVEASSDVHSQTNLNWNLRKEPLSIFIREATRKRQTERVIIRTSRWGITLTFFDMMSEAQLSFQFFFFVFTQIIESVTFTMPRERYTISAANARSYKDANLKYKLSNLPDGH